MSTWPVLPPGKPLAAPVPIETDCFVLIHLNSVELVALEPWVAHEEQFLGTFGQNTLSPGSSFIIADIKHPASSRQLHFHKYWPHGIFTAVAMYNDSAHCYILAMLSVRFRCHLLYVEILAMLTLGCCCCFQYFADSVDSELTTELCLYSVCQ